MFWEIHAACFLMHLRPGVDSETLHSVPLFFAVEAELGLCAFHEFLFPFALVSVNQELIEAA